MSFFCVEKKLDVIRLIQRTHTLEMLHSATAPSVPEIQNNHDCLKKLPPGVLREKMNS